MIGIYRNTGLHWTSELDANTMETRMLVELVQHDQGRFDHYLEAWDMKYRPNSDWNHARGAAFGSIRLDPGVNYIEISINSF